MRCFSVARNELGEIEVRLIAGFKNGYNRLQESARNVFKQCVRERVEKYIGSRVVLMFE